MRTMRLPQPTSTGEQISNRSPARNVKHKVSIFEFRESGERRVSSANKEPVAARRFTLNRCISSLFRAHTSKNKSDVPIRSPTYTFANSIPQIKNYLQDFCKQTIDCGASTFFRNLSCLFAVFSNFSLFPVFFNLSDFSEFY